MNKYIANILSCILILLILYIFIFQNRKCNPGSEYRDVVWDTVRVTVWDTVGVREPVAVENKPVGVKNYRIKLLGVIGKQNDSIGKQNGKQNDSVEVELPIEQKVYSDSLYKAWVSGFDARLDSIYIYQPTRYITIKTTEQQSQWSWGVQGGVGITPKGLQPYIGLGFQFKF